MGYGRLLVTLSVCPNQANKRGRQKPGGKANTSFRISKALVFHILSLVF
jgi:hypothetical protein